LDIIGILGGCPLYRVASAGETPHLFVAREMRKLGGNLLFQMLMLGLSVERVNNRDDKRGWV
jgi:hypothetical protein